MVKFARITPEPCEKLAKHDTKTHGCLAWFVRCFACPSDSSEPSPVRMALGIDWNAPWGCSPLPSRAEKRQSATEPKIGNCEWDPRLAWFFWGARRTAGSTPWWARLVPISANCWRLWPALCFSSSGGAGLPWRDQLGIVKPGLGIPSGHNCQRKSGWHEAFLTKIPLGRVCRDD